VRNFRGTPRKIKGLLNAGLMAKRHPKTFFVPSDAAIRKIKPGDFVKVARNRERFWLRVTGWVGKKWHGTVANKLILNDDLSYGTSIFFTRKNIYDTLTAKRMAKEQRRTKTS
jgi:hypothetical protein